MNQKGVIMTKNEEVTTKVKEQTIPLINSLINDLNRLNTHIKYNKTRGGDKHTLITDLNFEPKYPYATIETLGVEFCLNSIIEILQTEVARDLKESLTIAGYNPTAIDKQLKFIEVTISLINMIKELLNGKDRRESVFIHMDSLFKQGLIALQKVRYAFEDCINANCTELDGR